MVNTPEYHTSLDNFNLVTLKGCMEDLMLLENQ